MEGAAQGRCPSDVLQTGDIVLLKCQLRDHEPYAEASDQPEDTGYVKASGLNAELTVLPLQSLNTLDVRELLFVVVEQLSYIAQKDLNRRRKHLASQGGTAGSSVLAQLQPYEERAKLEEQHNAERIRSVSRPVSYGEVVQLQHLRTQRFLHVRVKVPAVLQRTSRRVGLQYGTAKSWLRINPFFRHRIQGEPVDFREQVTLESVKLGSEWNLNWARCRNMARDEVLEVNCARGGRGFYFVLYNRKVTQPGPTSALCFPAPLRLFHPHHEGFLSASCAPSKRRPYLQRGSPGWRDQAGRCAKTVWILEPATPAPEEPGVEWGRTGVLLRHFGSGRYLAVCEADLREAGIAEELPPLVVGGLPHASAGPPSPQGMQLGARLAQGLPGPLLRSQGMPLARVELVTHPGPACVFVLEPGSANASMGGSTFGFRDWVPQEGACLALRWNCPTGPHTLWLSCQGSKKGVRNSLHLEWSLTRYSCDAIQVEPLGADPWMLECDIVAEHVACVRKAMVPRCCDFDSTSLAAMICAQCEHALSDMIFFLADSPAWRSGEAEATQPDALQERWTAKPQRQQLVRELRYIDASFDLFHELVRQTPALVEGDVRWGRRAAALNLSMHVDAGVVGPAKNPQAWGRVLGEMVASMKTRCLKLLVRLWLYCFIGSPESARYFCRRGWLDVVDGLNGHGLGASEVFVALLSTAPELIRRVEKPTLLKFICFIRVLGPQDNWLHFLRAACGGAGCVSAMKQQQVLRSLVFAGRRAAEAERAEAARNRAELLVAVRLAGPLGLPLSEPLPGSPPPPLEQCLAGELLVHGLHDVAISWAHPERWAVGQAVLFHSPQALGLTPLFGEDTGGCVWVSLVQVAWVLQPECCCEAATGEPWEERRMREGESLQQGEGFPRADTATPQSASPLDSLRTLAKFFLAQLRLIASLVRERQMNCIMALQEEYSFSLCLCGASDPRLPTSIRAAFYDLLTDLWIDRHPHLQVVVPELMRHLDLESDALNELPTFRLHQVEQPEAWSKEHLDSLPAEVQQFFKLGQPHKLEAVVRAVRRYLSTGYAVEQQVHSATDDNALMCAVLRVLGLLFRFGFVHSVALLDELLGPLLRCLDGRTDWLSAPPEAPAPEVLALGEGEGEGAAGTPPSPPGPLEPLLLATEGPRGGAEAWPRAAEPPGHYTRLPPDDGGRRYVDCDDNRDLFAAKAQMLHAALHVMRVGVHTQVSRTLFAFCTLVYKDKAGAGEGQVPPLPEHKVSAVVDQVMQGLDQPVVRLSHPHIRAPNEMCMDLLMYEDPTIFALALQLLFEICCQTSELLERLDKVEILTPTQAKLFQVLKTDVAVLGKLIYNFELWAADDEFSDHDVNKFKHLERICLKLQKLCVSGDEATTPVEAQKMLHETEFFSHLAYALKVDLDDLSPSCGALLSQLRALMCRTASRFVAGNLKNQNLVSKVVPSAIAVLDEQPECALLMAEIYRGNLELCQQVPLDLVTHFGNLVARERDNGKFVPWYLMFYSAIVGVGAQPVIRNQTVVIEVLQRLTPAATLHLLQSDAGLERIMQLAGRFASMEQLRNPDASTWRPGDDAELIYYTCSVELLVGLAKGHGSQSLVNKPFVNSLFPAVSAMQLLLHASVADMDPGLLGSPSAATIRRHLKILWLQLVQLLLYDVDTSLLETDVLASPLHVEFFGAMLAWVQDLLRPQPGAGQGDDALMSEEEEDLLRAMLLCIDAFFAAPYQALGDIELSKGLADVARHYQNAFAPLLGTGGSGARPAAPHRGLRDTESLRLCAQRVTGSVKGCTGATGAATPRVDRGGSGGGGAPRAGQPPTGARGTASSSVEAQWRGMIRALGRDARIQERLRREEEQPGRLVVRAGELTDPHSPEYLRALQRNPGGGPPDGVDFRRTIVTTEDVLRRFVRHCDAHLRSDMPTLRRVQRTLLAMLISARVAGDATALRSMQLHFVRTGVAKLVIRMLDAKVSDEITSTSWTLLAEILRSNDPAQQVNRNVQQALLDVCTNGDDSGMWESFGDILRAVSSKVKSMRKLKHLSSLTEEEREQCDEYDTCLAYAVKAMQAVRLLVEGHFYPMQDYLYSQIGNSKSCNVPEVAAQLMIAMGKDPSTAEFAGQSELECVEQVSTLLTELSQGPNLRNQEFLSSFGIVETVFKLLAANFDRLRWSEDDLYPPYIRRLKAQFVEMLLALLEGRLDTVIHATMLQRIDKLVLRERLQFVHRYFVFGTVAVARGTVASSGSTALPSTSPAAPLLSPDADPTEVHGELTAAGAEAEELIEDLGDEELDELFSEGLSMLELVFMVMPHSGEFASAVLPAEGPETFVDDPARYSTERDFLRERMAHHRQENYRRAFNFLRRFVKTIEVVLNGHLQSLHFQQPLTAMWYVHGAAKQHILDSIPFSSPDTKARAFVQMCAEAHGESKLIRELSHFSVVPPRYLRAARRHLPDGVHRPFQIFLANDARLMQWLLRLALLLGIALAGHAGLFLLPPGEGEEGEEAEGPASPHWGSPLAAAVAYSLGSLYFACTLLWVALTVSIRLPLAVAARAGPGGVHAAGLHSWRAVAGTTGAVLGENRLLWRLILLVCCGNAVFLGHFWLFSFLLVDCFCQIPLLATVLSAITAPAKQLLLTGLGMVIFTFVYAAIGFHSFREDFGQYCDENILTCTQNILYQGTRSSIIGLSGMMRKVMPKSPDWPQRVTYDMSYFIVFGIMFLNTIVALIVDSFVSARMERLARDHNLETETFISCINRKAIEAAAQKKGITDGFKHHETQMQSKWDYMAFVFHLREKNVQDYTGPEQTIRLLIENKDVSWLPLGRSKLLEGSEEQASREDALVGLARQARALAEGVEASGRSWRALADTVAAMDAAYRQRTDAVLQEIRSLQAFDDLEDLRCESMRGSQSEALMHRRSSGSQG